MEMQANWLDICETVAFISPEAAEILMTVEVSEMGTVHLLADDTNIHRWAEVEEFLRKQGYVPEYDCPEE